MSDDRKRPPVRPPPREAGDDEVVEIPPTQRYGRPEPFRRVAATPADVVARFDEVIASHREVLATQRKLALQLDGFGAAMNGRFDVLHGEVALLRHGHDELLALVSSNHGPRLEKVETTLGQKVARGGGIVGLLIVALPMLADALPKYRALFEALGGALQ